MKPSERIYQIWEEICKSKGLELDSLGSMPYHPYAIAKYLDEQKEAEHKNHDISECIECKNNYIM